MKNTVESAIVFSGSEGLDLQEIRNHIIRIPEVSVALTEAQEVWDRSSSGEFSFHNFLPSENHLFVRSLLLKNLTTAVVQVGLYRRFVKKFVAPRYLVGNHHGASPLRVCSGETSLERMVENSQMISKKIASRNMGFQKMPPPSLRVLPLTKYSIYKNKKGSGYVSSDLKSHHIKPVIDELIKSYRVHRLISIGPGHGISHKDRQAFLSDGIHFLESIELDPMLSWFWPQVCHGHEWKVVN